MANIISNQVYYSVQAETFDTSDTTGKIIYANRFAPNGEVALDDARKKLLDSNLGYSGNNILVQLEQKIQALPNGPWYIDTRNGTIYIHNRKFAEMPIYTYIYASENSELLKADFRTEYHKKHRDGQVVEGFDLDKNFHHAQLNINDDLNDYVGGSVLEQTQKVQEAAAKYRSGEIDKATYNMVLAANPDTNIFLSPQAGWDVIMGDIRVGAEARQAQIEEQDRAYAEYQAAEEKTPGTGNKELQRQELNRSLASEDVSKEADRIILQIAAQMAGGKTEQASKYYKQIKNEIIAHSKKGDLESWCKNFFSATHQMTSDSWSSSNQPYQVLTKTFTTSDFTGPISTNKEYTALKSSRDVKIINEQSNSTTTKSSEGEFTTTTTTVTYMVRQKVNPAIPQYRVVLASLSQQYGATTPSDIEDRILRASNSQKAIVERKLTVRLEVVGNPFLQTSKIVNILNVGKRWQGSWYIKSASHLLQGSKGYVTQLELVKNSSKAGTSVVNGSVNISQVHTNNAKEPAVSFTADDQVVYSIVASRAKQKGDVQELTRLAYALASGHHVKVDHNTTTTGLSSDVDYTQVKYTIPETTQEEKKKAQSSATNLINNVLNSNPDK